MKCFSLRSFVTSTYMALACVCVWNAVGGRASHAGYIDEVMATSGLVATWRLGETAGPTAVEEVGTNSNANDGVYTNFLAGDFNQPGLLPFDSNTAARFNGSNSYVNAGNDSSLNGAWSGVTMLAWVNPVSTTGISLIGGKWAGVATSDHFGMFIFNGKLMGAVGNGVTGVSGTQGTATIPNGEDTFVAFTWQSGTGAYQFYMNGANDPISSVGTTVSSINTGSTKDFFIGAQSAGFRHFNGIIDEVAIFDRVLSASEISDLYLSAITAPPVPEPHTAWLVCSGLLCAIRMHCRKREGAKKYATGKPC